MAVVVGRKFGWVQDSGSVDFPGCLRCLDMAVAVVAMPKVTRIS